MLLFYNWLKARYICEKRCSGTVKYLDEVLKSLVMLLKLFEKADRFVVVTAEFSIYLLHFLTILIGKLQKNAHKHPVVHTPTTFHLLHLRERYTQKTS